MIGKESFLKTESLSLSSNYLILILWLNLPKLELFQVEKGCFSKAKNINVDSTELFDFLHLYLPEILKITNSSLSSM